MAHAVRQTRYDQVAAQAKLLRNFLCSEETAASLQPQRGSREAGREQDPLLVRNLPPLPETLWGIWRRGVEQIASLAAEAGLRSDLPTTDSISASATPGLVQAIAALQRCLDDAIQRLVLSPRGDPSRSSAGGQSSG